MHSEFLNSNALSGGYPISTLHQLLGEEPVYRVSMPYRATIPFLLNGWSAVNPFDQVCQCPIGRLSHFYLLIGWDMIKRRGVSMPYRAAIPFLPPRWVPVTLEYSCVNALSGGYPISTHCGANRGIVLVNVSMPYRAAIPFLPSNELAPRRLYQRCQCPIGRLSHFYGYLPEPAWIQRYTYVF